MPWFWGSSKNDDDDDEYSSYDDSSESGSFLDESEDDDDDDDNGPSSFGEEEEDDPDASNNNSNLIDPNDDSEDKNHDSDENQEVEDVSKQQQQQQQSQDQQSSLPTTMNDDDDDRLRRCDSLTSHDQDDDDDQDELLLLQTLLPSTVGGAARTRAMSSAASSVLCSGEEEDENNGNEDDDPGHHLNHNNIQKSAAAAAGTDQDADEEEEEDEEVTSLAEKQSLLLLAAENDRVDILQAILSSSSSPNNNNNNDTTSDEANSNDNDNNNNTEREFLLNPVTKDGIVTTIPPLHIAVSYGSINTINCLLRLGANPSLRPNVALIRTLQQQQTATAPEIPHMQRFDGWSAWELAFGQRSSISSSSTNANAQTDQDCPPTTTAKSRTSWLFRSGSSQSGSLEDDSGSARGSSRMLLPPSKQESIRHAFTAEALRCLGADEVERLRQLLHAGMPPDTIIGHQSLWDWAVDWNATQCQLELQQQQLLTTTNNTSENGTKSSTENNNNNNNSNGPLPTNNSSTPSHPRQTAVLDRRVASPQHDNNSDNTTTTSTTAALVNRLDELESLARALSECLDHLAEEVSVCTGLLLVGSGAAALASHVRSLKATRQRKYDEWVWITQAGEQAQDELAYWQREYGIAAASGTEEMKNHWTKVSPTDATPESSLGADPNPNDNETADQQQQQQQQQLQVQIGAMEHKIRMLRASITDLSEENVRNLAQVERRGLSGGIALVRGLRDEIREIEFELAEAKRSEAACRAQLALLQARMKNYKKNPAPPVTTTTNGLDGGAAANGGGDGLETRSAYDLRSTKASSEPTGELEENEHFDSDDQDYDNIPESERIATGQSTALIVRPVDQRRGFLPYHLWRIFLRIMGLSDDEAQQRSAAASSSPAPVVMIL